MSYFKSPESERRYYDSQAEGAAIARNLVRDGKFNEGWEIVRRYLQNKITKEEWIKSTIAFLDELQANYEGHCDAIYNAG